MKLDEICDKVIFDTIKVGNLYKVLNLDIFWRIVSIDNNEKTIKCVLPEQEDLQKPPKAKFNLYTFKDVFRIEE